MSTPTRLQLLENFYAAAMDKHAWLVAWHNHDCPSGKLGKKHGPCNCPGDEAQKRIDEALAALADAVKA
jgi:hypothetical protein